MGRPNAGLVADIIRYGPSPCSIRIYMNVFVKHREHIIHDIVHLATDSRHMLGYITELAQIHRRWTRGSFPGSVGNVTVDQTPRNDFSNALTKQIV